MNEFVSKIRGFCLANSLLTQDGRYVDGIVVGLSGGPDSVALLKVLEELRSEGVYEGAVYAAHINHLLRPGDCDEDEEFVRDLCSRHNIPLVCERTDVAELANKTGRTVEEAGRILRYRVFEEYRSSLPGVVRIAVAHHGDDVTETFMMNLFRGSGLEGLTGMKPLSGNIIRPLLCVTKQEILDYLGDTPYRTDHTNFESEHTRNMWRNEIMPRIAEVSVKTPRQAVWDTSQLLASDSEYIASETYKAYDLCKVETGGVTMLDAARLRMFHRSISSRVIRHLYLLVAGTLKDFETVNLEDASDVLNGDSGRRADMPHNIVCFMQNGLFGFAPSERMVEYMEAVAAGMGFVTAPEGYEQVIRLNSLSDTFYTELPDSGIQISVRIIENYEDIEYNGKSWFCPLELISGDPVICTPAGGSAFRKAGSEGSKPVRQLLKDLKVPREVRDRIVGIRDDQMVCFIPGIGHGKGFVSELSMARCLEGAAGDREAGRVLEIRFG
ncbi:tRNA(Ile)-lysidine synthase [Ruminococcaceae bacterium YRB3002]|nr:tRNA(Ile)-lysidine synthase [Ruminococcaceae bacterium YRB3002]